MIVIGVDVHKHSFTAVALDEVGRMLDEGTVASGVGELIVWASELGAEQLSRPRADEEIHRDMKLLVDHRDDCVDERRRMQPQRLRWHLHQLDPSLVVPLRILGRANHLERVGRVDRFKTAALEPDTVLALRQFASALKGFAWEILAGGSAPGSLPACAVVVKPPAGTEAVARAPPVQPRNVWCAGR